MNTYALMLFVHFLSLVAAVAAAALSGFAALRLRGAETAPEAARWGAFVRRVVPVFPVASLGLIGTGAYMTSLVWGWSTPWIGTGFLGLIMIMVLGGGVEGSRGRAASAELRAAGLSERARGLLRDPIAWSARVTTWALIVAVIFMMTVKPTAIICAISLALALVVGVAAAVPFWSSSGRTAAQSVRDASR